MPSTRGILLEGIAVAWRARELRRGTGPPAARSRDPREGVVPKAENSSRCSRSKNEPIRGTCSIGYLFGADLPLLALEMLCTDCSLMKEPKRIQVNGKPVPYE